MSNDDKFDIVGRITKKEKAKKIRERIESQQSDRTHKITMDKLNQFVHGVRQEAHQEGWNTGYKVGHSSGRKRFFLMGLAIGIFIGVVGVTIGWAIS